MKTDRKIQAWIGCIVIVLFFVLIAVLIFIPIPEPNESILKILLGALATLVITIVNWWFGSSKGSADKQELLNR